MISPYAPLYNSGPTLAQQQMLRRRSAPQRRATLGLPTAEEPAAATGAEGSGVTGVAQPPAVSLEQGPGRGITAPGKTHFFIQGRGPTIDFGPILRPRSTGMDPMQGDPFKGTSGVGGFFRRMLGDNSDELNAQWGQQRVTTGLQNQAAQQKQDFEMGKLRAEQAFATEQQGKAFGQQEKLETLRSTNDLNNRNQEAVTRNWFEMQNPRIQADADESISRAALYKKQAEILGQPRPALPGFKEVGEFIQDTNTGQLYKVDQDGNPVPVNFDQNGQPVSSIEKPGILSRILTGVGWNKPAGAAPIDPNKAKSIKSEFESLNQQNVTNSVPNTTDMQMLPPELKLDDTGLINSFRTNRAAQKQAAQAAQEEAARLKEEEEIRRIRALLQPTQTGFPVSALQPRAR
jgi:hypothetical protein